MMSRPCIGVFGDAGVGKTSLIFQGRFDNVKVVDVEGVKSKGVS